MKKQFVWIALAAILFAFAGCAPTPKAKKIADIPDITKAYLAGLEEYSTFTVDLSEYVDANGTEVAYTATSEFPDGCKVSVEGNTLSATVCTDGELSVNVEVSSNGKKAFDLSFIVSAYPCTRVACVGDSLKFEPDVVFLMLGTNDGYNWTGSASAFDAEYRKLISSYLDGGADTVILMTAPPTLEKNAFNLPNDVIRDNVCPAQRAVAEDMGLPLLDLRTLLEEQEDLTSLYRPGDGVHFSVAGATLVAQYAADALKRA